MQTTFAPLLTIRNATPSFVTIVVALYALQAGGRRGAFLGLIAGALTDAVAGTGGGWTIAYTLVALGCGAVARGFFADGIVPPSFLVGCAVLVRDAIFWIVMIAEGYPRGYATVHLHAALESALFTAVCALVYGLWRVRFRHERTRIERYA